MAADEGGAGDSSAARSTLEQPSGLRGFTQLVAESPANAAMFFLRFGVLIASLGYVSGLMNSFRSFRWCMCLYGLASGIRLYQRRPPATAPKVFWLLEDSAHNIIYAVIMVLTQPLFAAVVSPAVFSYFQSTTYLNKLIERTIPSRHLYLGQMINRFASKEQAQNGFRMVAKSEAALLLLLLMRAVTSLSINAIVTATIYAQLCSFRAVSKRNPYPREVWRNVRLWIDNLLMHRFCPGLVQRTFQRMFDALDENMAQTQRLMDYTRQFPQQ